jgi:23S rRNA (cytidine1920-2'-O)/16S rRNA (cytidine1409-2'-O)-methyltransferase
MRTSSLLIPEPRVATPVPVVELIAEVPKYVCRAGVKLEAAFERWSELRVEGKVALDAGAVDGAKTAGLLAVRPDSSRCC